MFSCEFWEMFENTVFTEHLGVNASFYLRFGLSTNIPSNQTLYRSLDLNANGLANCKNNSQQWSFGTGFLKWSCKVKTAWSLETYAAWIVVLNLKKNLKKSLIHHLLGMKLMACKYAPSSETKYSKVGKVNFVDDSIQKIWSKICLSRPYPIKFFKGCLPQNLLSTLLNTLPHL